jgi:hypothetical protein
VPAVAQEPRGELHPPEGQVLHRRLADHPHEALGEDGAREADQLRKGSGFS